jgi:hypothetical protein
MKHSSTSDRVVHKFVYTSPDNRYLCWKSVDKDDEKKIELISISNVIKEGAEFYLRTSAIQQLNSCVVIRSEERSLQFEWATEEEAEYFRYEMVRAVKFSRNMRLNYKYHKQ